MLHFHDGMNMWCVVPSYLKGAKTCILPSPGSPDTLMDTYSLKNYCLSWTWFVGMWISDPVPVEKVNLGNVTGSFPVRAHFSVAFKSPGVKKHPDLSAFISAISLFFPASEILTDRVLMVFSASRVCRVILESVLLFSWYRHRKVDPLFTASDPFLHFLPT